MKNGYESSINTDSDGNVTLTFNAKTWAKTLKLAGQIIHTDECARNSWKEGKPEAALIFYDRISNNFLARLFTLTPVEFQNLMLDEAKNANEGK